MNKTFIIKTLIFLNKNWYIRKERRQMTWLLNRDQQIEEIINLEAILNLPKGTEHFVSDLHGEFEAFDHILRNGSGRIREKFNFYLNKN